MGAIFGDQGRQMADNVSRTLKNVNAIFGGRHATLSEEDGALRIGLQLA